MPRDIDPAVAGPLAGVSVVDMDRVQRRLWRAAAADADAARRIVVAEVADHLAWQRMAEVTPTVTALRQRNRRGRGGLLRLISQVPGLDPEHQGRGHAAPRTPRGRPDSTPTVRGQAAGQFAGRRLSYTPRRCVSSSSWTARRSMP